LDYCLLSAADSQTSTVDERATVTMDMDQTVSWRQLEKRLARTAAAATGATARACPPTSGHVATALREASAALTRDAVVVEMSSGVPSVTRSLASELRDRGVALVDWPVSGGVARAVTGDRTEMACFSEAVAGLEVA
jgi:3-hydroxyisobutyrate dehydrogenase-like beta-hydroxyacid dehydrogenase